MDEAQPGDTILVHEGEYEGCRISRPGHPDAWITLKAVPGLKVRINRPGPKNKHRSIVEAECYFKDTYPAYWVIEGFRISGAKKAGIDIRGTAQRPVHDFIVRNNYVEKSGRTGIFFAFCNNAIAEGNFSRFNGEHGIYVSNSSDFPTVRGNLLEGNYGCGLHVNGDANMGGDGLVSYGLIEANWIWDNGKGGGAALNFDGLMDGTARRNYIFGNKAGGITLFKIDATRPSSRNLIESNVIHMPKGSRWAINVTNTGADGNLIAGNIIYTESHRGSIRLPDPKPKLFVSNNNEMTGKFSLDSGDTCIGWEQWRALGFDINSVEAGSPPDFKKAAKLAGGNDIKWVENWAPIIKDNSRFIFKLN